MFRVESAKGPSAKVISFDCRGAQRRRIDDVFPLVNSAATPFGHTFKLHLKRSPATFQWDTTLRGAPPVVLTWNSVFAGVGVAHVLLGDAPAH